MPETTYDQVHDLAQSLAVVDRLRLIADIASELSDLGNLSHRKTIKSAYGALKDLGPAPSAEDIDEVRREAWASFPREDI